MENRLQRAEGGAEDQLGEERREAARFGVQDVPAIWKGELGGFAAVSRGTTEVSGLKAWEGCLWLS